MSRCRLGLSLFWQLSEGLGAWPYVPDPPCNIINFYLYLLCLVAVSKFYSLLFQHFLKIEYFNNSS